MISVDALKPEAALKYWSGKVPVSKSEFDHLNDQARAKAFTVSGLSKLDQVTAVQQALAKVMDEGGTLVDFKAQISDIIKAQGWTGKKAHRVDNIFRTNLQTAYMAGRYEQMQKTTRLRPYWRYLAVEDKRTRPSHTALDGKVYPADHDFWNSFYPPNGFRCRCTVQSLSERQVKKAGYQIETEMPGTTMVRLPDGSEINVNPMPDKGWSRNVGKDWLAGLEPSEVDGKLKTLSDQALCSSGQFAKGDSCRPPLTDLDSKHILEVAPEDILDAKLSKDEHVLAFLKEFGLSKLDDQKVLNVHGYPLVVSRGLFLDKSTGEYKNTWQDKGPYMKLLARTIQNPYEVWWVPVEAGPHKTVRYSLRLIRAFRLPGSKQIAGYSSFSLIGREWLAATTFAPKANRSEAAILKYLESQRAGVLVYREGGE